MSATDRPNPAEDARLALSLGALVAHAATIPIEVYIRRNFGVRYMGMGQLLLGWIFLLVLQWSGFMRGAEPVSMIWNCFVLGYLALGLAQIYQLGQDDRYEAQVHSRSPGNPAAFWYQLGAPAELVPTLLEPGAVLVLGFLLSGVDPPLSVYLQIGAMALCLKELVLAKSWRDLRLDASDAQVQSEHLIKDVDEKGSRTTARTYSSFYVVPVGAPPGTPKSNEDLSVESATKRLHPDLRTILAEAGT